MSRIHRVRSPFHPSICAAPAFFLLAAVVHAGVAPPSFSKAFLPATIGPGSVSVLQFTITNGNPGTSVTNLAFVDNLPAGVTLANPASASTTCAVGTVTAPDGGGTVTFSGGSLGPSSSCTISVNVTSSTVGTHANVSGDLTSDAGNSGPALADLAVATDRPGFSKAFAPSTINLGGRSTLTFLIDNTANPSLVFNVGFADVLPNGMVIASPGNAATTCTNAVLTAPDGGSSVAIATGLVLAGATCTVSVDVIGSGVGTLINTSGELNSAVAGPLRSSGRATASLGVQAGVVAVTKSFTDDPALPGGTVTLEFTVTNRDRNFDATVIAFSDDLDATLSGLVATGLPLANPCGPGSQLSGTSLISLTGGNLAADGGTCTFSVTLQVPAGAATGGYPNTTSAVTALLGGSPFVGLSATETLFVNNAPSLTKTFLTNPIGAGDTTPLEFTLTNNSATSSATAISFRDNLDTFLNGVTASSLPPAGFCGGGSTLTQAVIGANQFLIVNNASLAAGDSCTFSVGLTIPPGTAAGLYVNTTQDLVGTVDGTPQVGAPAGDTLVVVGAPTLRKEFTDDPVLPGATVNLAFTLIYSESATSDATAIAFTDDLTATLAGLVAIGLPANDVCGVGSVLSGTTNLTLTGGTLAPGTSCTFNVSLQVPVGALPGSYPNQTSNVMASVNGLPVTTNGGADSLQIAGVTFSKAFTDDPVVAGDTVTLEFTIVNNSPVDDATNIAFTDNVNATLTGLAAVGLPLNDVCGVGSQISGTNNLVFTGGNLLAGASCTFAVTLQVPGGAADGGYLNLTSSLSATVQAATVILPPARDVLTVSSELLTLAKEFTDDPVSPGGTVTLEFTVTNLDAGQAASSLTFTDDLDAALVGLVATGLPVNDVCGIGSQISGTSLLTLTGGNLAAGGSCTFSVMLNVPPGVPGGTDALNTTSSVSGTIGGLPVNGAPATDSLQIDALTFSKSFDGPTIAGGMPVLTLVIENQSVTTPVSDLSFTDDLNAVLAGLVAVGLPQNDACGIGSVLSGTSLLSLTGGALLPGGSCSIVVTLQVPAGASPGTYPNITSDLFQGGLSAAAPATADLVVADPPPLFEKIFAPDAVSVGGVSTLTLTIDNTASTIAATALAFVDNLPAGLTVATPAASSTTCTGGVLTAVSGNGVITYSGGSVAAGASCTLQVDVVANAAGLLVNTTGDLTSSLGNSGTAGATLTAVEAAPFSKSFLASPVLPGGLVELQYTISNPSATSTLDQIQFTDDLGAVIPGWAAVGLPAADVCGVGSQVSGTTVINLTGGTLAPGTSCTFAVTVKLLPGAPLGTVTSTSSPLTFSVMGSGNTLQAPPAVDEVTVAFLAFSKAFEAGSFRPGDVVALTFSISNPDPVNSVAGITFSDDLGAVLPGLTALGLPLADVCGVGSQISGTTVVVLTGGNLGPGEACTFDIAVLVPAGVATGTYTNVTSALDAIVDSSAVTGGAASVATADLDVLAPVLEIPTLSEWGLLMLIGLFAVVAVRRLGTMTK